MKNHFSLDIGRSTNVSNPHGCRVVGRRDDEGSCGAAVPHLALDQAERLQSNVTPSQHTSPCKAPGGGGGGCGMLMSECVKLLGGLLGGTVSGNSTSQPSWIWSLVPT